MPTDAEILALFPDITNLDETNPAGFVNSSRRVFATKREAVVDEYERAVAAAASRRVPDRFVYFIGDPHGREVKIGVAKDPWRRVVDLRVGTADAIEVLAVLPGGLAEERALHIEFAEWRIRGEWFRLCPAIKARIRGVLRDAPDWQCDVRVHLARGEGREAPTPARV